MPKSSHLSSLIKASTPDERLQFILETFSETSLAHTIGKAVADTYGELTSIRFGVNFVAALSTHFCFKRDAGSLTPSVEGLKICATIQSLKHFVDDSSQPERPRALVRAYLDALGKDSEKRHAVLEQMLDDVVTHFKKKLHSSAESDVPARGRREGDVIAEGPGFEVVVGPRMQNIVDYPLEGRAAVLVIHDPRDGHFLLIERYCPISGHFVLEMPKAPPATGSSRDAMIDVVLREQTGLTHRKLEKIGELQPDSMISRGEYDVYYGTFDLEENFEQETPYVRSLKRLTEEGFSQAALEGRIKCALTHSAISMWRAFEPVRKKRLANAKRVRTKPGEEETEE